MPNGELGAKCFKALALLAFQEKGTSSLATKNFVRRGNVEF
jgi:hypothetical protein